MREAWAMQFRKPPAGEQPEPDDDLDLHVHNQFQVVLQGLNRFMKEAARSAHLNAQLDLYLAQNPRPRPDEDAPLDSPELD